MSSWVVTALILNAALVVAAIVFAVRFAGRSVVIAVKVELERSSAASTVADGASRLPLFSAAQMTRTEWHALLDAFDRARVIYVKELVKASTARASVDGSLARATHAFEAAKRRLIRFELEVTAGSSYCRR